MVEMLVVIAIIGILAALLLPALTGGKQRAKRIVCESQLREIGIGFQSFAHDHNSKFPMQVSTNDNGSLEFVRNGNLINGQFYFGYRNFQSLADILQNPTILVCPADTRLPATNFATLQNTNISYFVGVNAEYDQPMSILAGDGNLAASSTMVHGTAGGRLTWNRALHVYKGNVLFADDHVEEWSDNGGSTLGSRTDLVLPTVGGSSSAPSTGQFGTASRGGGGANSAMTMNRAAGSESAAANPPNGVPASQPGPGSKVSDNHGDRNWRGGGQSQLEISNSIGDTTPVATNPADAKITSPKDDNSTMSPTNRKVARVLRDFLGGTYFLILLLVLLYSAYRVWRWQQDPVRKRRLKMEQRRARSDAES
jgi:type II secretory pathway pseudopilin PulG